MGFSHGGPPVPQDPWSAVCLRDVGTARRLGWKRVSILYTDTQWASDSAGMFTQAWKTAHGATAGRRGDTTTWEGKVAGTHSITVLPNNDLDPVSLHQVRAC